MVNILNLKDPTCIIFNSIYFSIYGGLNQGPSDPESGDKPIGHRASLENTPLIKIVMVNILRIALFI